MRRKKPYLLAGLVLLLFLLCTACGNTEGQIAPQDDPNEGLGGNLSEDDELDSSRNEASTYYAGSTMYDGVSNRVFEVDEDSLVWGDEGVYYMME